MTYALEISDLKKRYDNGFEALKGVNLKVEKGDFFALLGPNGAGKSTTIGIMCSLVNKTSGKVSISGNDIDDNFAKAKQHLGVVPQEFNFNVFETVFNVVVTQAGFYGIPAQVAEERAEKYLKQLGLWDKKDVQSRMLSGGMKRRLMIARALVHEPEILILDEPTAGVDIELRRSMWEFITELNESGTTIILTTHYLEEAEQLCRNIAIINAGEIVENTSVKALLKTLNQETFILDLSQSIDNDFALPDYKISTSADGMSLEIEVTKGQSLNGVVLELDRLGCQVLSMRNKSNRLEELFVKLTNG
ncbi:ABC transporter ATP-binding protein [Marinomonas mediterranea]|jgi:ABC-type multidrug transport system, ATPase component|uniref:Polyamine-transporting ATPase n=1 Tax=Marinomonas mediterranea (strain ATCC 700492 / JCM 21426 / NBRC 103028 / MMB-1) TaxID=717774 RepID=F2K3B9_MARM1|nr:ATP-binding cassette domain-containing protein [Marinomonas mediterranea]ADZ91261.1 Polyamine-transporting ATPase [Marinomonas mediterranea MMB-1]WCN09233.1 ATP-binding cassette domain-containing protein [Marinomonas mediterranea]WCN13315.1 ATP-binding cassette domain-containing protein [Marinomonas mediterranea]WCN17383.1 ATP-binding cassette domain-containing protein [Marinomonas mediterranea MMB-1]